MGFEFHFVLFNINFSLSHSGKTQCKMYSLAVVTLS